MVERARLRRYDGEDADTSLSEAMLGTAEAHDNASFGPDEFPLYEHVIADGIDTLFGDTSGVAVSLQETHENVSVSIRSDGDVASLVSLDRTNRQRDPTNDGVVSWFPSRSSAGGRRPQVDLRIVSGPSRRGCWLKRYHAGGRALTWGRPVPRAPIFQTEEEIECPECGRMIPMQSENCPHCETALL